MRSVGTQLSRDTGNGGIDFRKYAIGASMMNLPRTSLAIPAWRSND